MRLIDADKIGIGKANPDVFENKAYADGWNSAIEIINAAPTVDAVAVIRCKDCEYAERYERIDGTAGYYCGHPQNIFTYGEHWDRVFKPIKETDDFCSYGARKDEENG